MLRFALVFVQFEEFYTRYGSCLVGEMLWLGNEENKNFEEIEENVDWLLFNARHVNQSRWVVACD